MLRILHIENVAVIESADVEFGKGLHVLTGETGAGKSIVIDAISAILGERTSREVIRTGASRAFVSAVFDEVAELGWFAETGVDYDPAELLVQRRNACAADRPGDGRRPNANSNFIRFTRGKAFALLGVILCPVGFRPVGLVDKLAGRSRECHGRAGHGNPRRMEVGDAQRCLRKAMRRAQRPFGW